MFSLTEKKDKRGSLQSRTILRIPLERPRTCGMCPAASEVAANKILCIANLTADFQICSAVNRFEPTLLQAFLIPSRCG